MPIPSSEPGKFKSAGSVGVQPDIGIGSKVFDALAETGKEFDKFRKERQKTLDNTASNRAVKMNKSLEETIEVAIVEAGAQNDPDSWGDIANGIVEQHRSDLGEITSKASKETKESISFHLEDTLGGINRSMFLKGAKVEQEAENQSIIARVNEEVRQAIDEDEIDAALKGYEEANLPPATITKLQEKALKEYRSNKIKIANGYTEEIQTKEQADDHGSLILNDKTLTAPQKESLLSNLNKKRISLNNAKDKNWLDQNKETIAESEDIEELKNLEIPEGTSQKAKNSFNSLRTKRVKALRLDKANTNLDVINGIGNGTITPDDIELLNLSEKERKFYNSVLDQRLSGFSRMDTEFKQAKKDIKTWAFSGSSKHGIFALEPDVDAKNKIWDRINSEDFNTDAQLLLGQMMIQAEGMDAADGEIDVATSAMFDMELDDDSSSAFREVGRLLSVKMGGPIEGGLLPAKEGGEIGEGFTEREKREFGFRTATVDPEDAWTAYEKIRTLAEDYLTGDSKNIETFRSESKKAINDAITNSQLNKLMQKRKEAAKIKRKKGAE